MSRTLFQYLFFDIIKRSALSLWLLAVLYSTIDVVETSTHCTVPTITVLLATPFRLPLTVSHMLPLALSLGFLFHIHSLRTRGEWTALCAAGVSATTIIRPAILLLIIVAPMSWCLIHTLAPMSMAHYEAITQSTRDVSPTHRRNMHHLTTRINERNDSITIDIQKDNAGNATAATFRRGSGKTRTGWTMNHGFYQPEAATDKAIALADNEGKPSPTIGGNGLLGASWMTRDLQREILRQHASGMSALRIETEISLRNSLWLAMIFVPLLTILFTARARKPVAFGGSILCTALSVAYWALLVTAVNGAHLGLWSPGMITVSVCIFSIVLAAPGLKRVIRLRPR